jgi:hypothetical protein
MLVGVQTYMTELFSILEDWSIVFSQQAKILRSGFCPTITENELSLMPYYTRIEEMDRVGVEPTTSDHRH